jgi:excisionase family DNA binding protein
MTTRQAHPYDATDDQLHDVSSAAIYLRCGPRLIYRLVRERKVTYTRAGRELRFWQSDLNTYLAGRTTSSLDAASRL